MNKTIKATVNTKKPQKHKQLQSQAHAKIQR